MADNLPDLTSTSSGQRRADRLVRIREYGQLDSAAVRMCVIELQEAERAIDPRLRPGVDMVDEYVRNMRARARDCAGTLLVVEVDGEVVGLTLLLTRVPFESLDEPPGNYALVAELVVREHMRGRGLGRALLDAAERRAREAGAAELRIGVLSGNTPARRLYLARGFESYQETLTKRLAREGM